ncbi:polysaccharide lyase family 4, domain III-domain-containing protein [Coniella lustricola]|uniref:rhamnogalacturonan endolyase n=1 Tax=Coniella lustricola TaxID=2025994 RepID=A0A2T2ZXH4_9PEZI|nr:polysaccharide lyase family 4, domain III-domain-containing protein [Coniella lustricola]
MAPRHQLVPSLGLASLLCSTASAAGPFLTQTGTQEWVFGNDLWNVSQGASYATKLYSTILPGEDLVGTAYGHYSDIDGATLVEYTNASIVASGDDWIDIAFESTDVDLHWVIFDDLQGAYHYMVNKATPSLEILRTLWRLNPDLFLNGRTNIKDDILPPFSLYANATEVQDETFELANGTVITKYDWSNFVRYRDYYGVYGPDVVGSWWIHPSTEYFTGSQLSQTLTVHRESSTGDSVQLNVFQDTSHFRVGAYVTPPVGKIWGPWLWYLNNGSKEDVEQRRAQELASWPYSWLNNTAYQTRGAITGTLTLSDGRPAAGASVFLGDTDTSIRPLVQGTNYYYTTQADASGAFSFPDVRTGAYGLYAWSDGGALADVYTNVTLTPVAVTAGETTALGELAWALPAGRTEIFRVGDFDKNASEFANGGLPYKFNVTSLSPANLTFVVGQSDVATDWYYASSALGTWTIQFEIDEAALAGYSANGSTALLSISLAGYSQSQAQNVDVNGVLLGTLDDDVLTSDPGLYRSSRISGEWRFIQYEIDPSDLVAGTNTIGFTITRFTEWRGFMWDSIFLEWQS